MEVKQGLKIAHKGRFMPTACFEGKLRRKLASPTLTEPPTSPLSASFSMYLPPLVIPLVFHLPLLRHPLRYLIRRLYKYKHLILPYSRA
jgi:hypothetical protein